MDSIEAFWQRAKPSASLPGVPVYTGVNPMDLLRPPAWAFGASPEQADELLRLVLTGDKTATASAVADYTAAQEELPQAGTLGIILDGRGEPHALVVTSRVRTARFDEVDAAHAHAEGEGDRSLEHWRAGHQAFFAEHSADGFAEDMTVVLEEFEVLYQEPDRDTL